MSVHTEESGTENPRTIVCVHGAGGSSATWFMQLRGLSGDLHVVAIDLNGHGKTPDRPSNDVRNTYIDDIRSVAEGYDRPILMGHSMGGALAQIYAHTHGDELGGLILVSTGARLRVSEIIFDLLDNDFDAYVEAVGKFMFHKDTSRKLVETSLAEVRKCPVDIIRRDFVMCNEFDMMEDVREIAIPTLIIVGNSDLMTPLKYSKYLHECIPNSNIRVIDGAGHSVMLEKPREFNSAILDWVASLS